MSIKGKFGKMKAFKVQSHMCVWVSWGEILFKIRQNINLVKLDLVAVIKSTCFWLQYWCSYWVMGEGGNKICIVGTLSCRREENVRKGAKGVISAKLKKWIDQMYKHVFELPEQYSSFLVCICVLFLLLFNILTAQPYNTADQLSQFGHTEQMCGSITFHHWHCSRLISARLHPLMQCSLGYKTTSLQMCGFSFVNISDKPCQK